MMASPHVPMMYGSPPLNSSYMMMMPQVSPTQPQLTASSIKPATSTVTSPSLSTSQRAAVSNSASLPSPSSASNPNGKIHERPADWQISPVNCTKCDTPFGMFRRSYPCACCNYPFCSSCLVGKADVQFATYTVPAQKVCPECESHLKRGSKTCLRRLIPYLQSIDSSPSSTATTSFAMPNITPQLTEALSILPDLVTHEPNYEVLNTLKLTDALLKLLPRLPLQGSPAPQTTIAAFRLVSLLVTIGVIPADNEHINPIVTVLTSALINPDSRGPLRVAAAQSASALAVDPRTLPILSASGLPAALMMQLNSNDDELLQQATSALAPLVKEGAKLSVEDCERLSSCLVPTSQGVLATDPAKAARSKEILQAILSILSKLTKERSHQEAVYVSGGVQVLMQVAQLDHSISTLSPIFEILTNVSKIPETIVAILHHNGLTTLLELLSTLIPEIQRQSSSSQTGKSRSDSERQRKNLTKQLLSLLLKLVHHSDDNFEDRERVISVVNRPDTLATLSALLPTERIGKVQKVVVELLLLSIISDEARTAAGKAHIVLNLVSLISISMAHTQGRHDKSSDHSSNRLPKLIGLLTALVRGHQANTAALVDCGVIALLLDILAPHTTSALTSEISRLLAAISTFPISHGFITSSIAQVVQLVSNTAPEIVEQGLTTLANLTAVPESRSIVFSEHTVNTVLPLMSSPKPGIQLQAAKFLSGIAQDPRASTDMFSSVLKPLVVQLTSQLTPVRHAAVTTLLDLLRSSQPKGGVDSSAGIKAMLAKADGAIAAIATIMASCKPPTPTHPEAELKRQCAELLALLAGNPTGRAVIASSSQSVQLILQSLFSPDEALVHWSVLSLASLLRIQDNNIAEAIRTSGGLAVFSRLLDAPSTPQHIHHATISSIALLFGYPACRQVLVDEGIIRRLLTTILDATKKLQAGQKIEATTRTRLFTAIAALQQLIQTAPDVGQVISKDAASLKSLADTIVLLTPKYGAASSPQADSDLCEQLIYLALLLCSSNSDTWPTMVRAGGLNFLLALASSRNLSAKRSSLNELAKLSLDISFRKIIFEGDGLSTAMHIIEDVPELREIVSSASSSYSSQDLNGSQAASAQSLGLQVLEKSLEVVTNVCEDSPALASLLQHNGAVRLVQFITRFVGLSPDIVQSKMVISIAYNMIRILLQMLMFSKPPSSQTLIPALPFLLHLISLDISQASYQSLQLTKIVCDTLVKMMEDDPCLRFLQHSSYSSSSSSSSAASVYIAASMSSHLPESPINATQVFLNLLVRYRPSLQSANIAEVVIAGLNKLIGQSSTNLSTLGLHIAPSDMESLFGYLKYPIVLRVVYALASDKHSPFQSSLDKASIEKLLPHLHSLLNTSHSSTAASASMSTDESVIDPITFITALFQTKPSQPPAFTILDDAGLIGLVHSLIRYLDPIKRVADAKGSSTTATSANTTTTTSNADGRILLNGLSLLSYMALRPCVHRPTTAKKSKSLAASASDVAGHRSQLLVSTDSTGLEAALSSLRASSLLQASQHFIQSDPPRLALLQLIFTITSVYFPEIHLDMSDVSPTATNSSTTDSSSPSSLLPGSDLLQTQQTNNPPSSSSLLDLFAAPKDPVSTTTSTLNLTPGPSSEASSNASSANKSPSQEQEMKPFRFNFAPIELMKLSELLLALLSPLSRSTSLHGILLQSGIMALVGNTLHLYLQLESETSSSSSDLSLATKQDIVNRQIPHALAILENLCASTSNPQFGFVVTLTSVLFEILALGVPRSIMISILDVLKVLTGQKAAVKHVLAVDGLMSLIGLLSNDNNHVTSLSLSILCNLAKFDEVQLTLSSLIDGSLLQELSTRPQDSELSFNVDKLKSFLGFVE